MDLTWPKIIQLIPNTTETVARFKDDDDEKGYFNKIIYFWALLEQKDGCRYVVGFDGCEYPEDCTTASNFIGYFQEFDKYHPNIHVPIKQTNETIQTI